MVQQVRFRGGTVDTVEYAIDASVQQLLCVFGSDEVVHQMHLAVGVDIRQPLSDHLDFCFPEGGHHRVALAVAVGNADVV